MLNNQTVKSDNQRHAMRQRQRQLAEYKQEHFALTQRLNAQRNKVREMSTDDTTRDGTHCDCGRPAFIRETRRVRNLEARVEFISRKMARIQQFI